VPAATTSTIIGLVVSNIHSAEISIDIQVTDTSAGTTVYMLKAAPIPIGGAIVPIGGEQKVVLETTDVLKITSDTASSADVIVSVLEQS
jgi:hypothetical protein